MTNELSYLVLVTALTAVMWIPYILNTIAVRGIADTVGYPRNPKPLAPWASRMKSAHANAVENLVVFAALVLTAHAVNVSNGAMVMACQVYFWTRFVHWLAYTLAVPWVRTIAFVVGFGCQMTLAWQILK
jgi:uncharacterized MAPEG superfamily protein